MLGSVVQVHLSPPKTGFKTSSKIRKPASSPVLMRVFCFLSVFNVHSLPVLLGALLGIHHHHQETDAPKLPKIVNPLTDTQVKNAKPKDKTYGLFDGGGRVSFESSTAHRFKSSRISSSEISLLRSRTWNSLMAPLCQQF